MGGGFKSLIYRLYTMYISLRFFSPSLVTTSNSLVSKHSIPPPLDLNLKDMVNYRHPKKEVPPMNKLTITISDKNQVTVRLNNPIDLPQVIQILQTATLSFMKSAKEQLILHNPDVPSDIIEQDIYDMYNFAASNTLNLFAPDLSLRPDLTEEAILEAENNIIRRKYKELKKNESQSQQSSPELSQPNPNAEPTLPPTNPHN